MNSLDVYVGTVAQVPWGTDPSSDDDKELETTPEEVVQILGFDPKELDDE